MTDSLKAGESAITKNGIWISKDWVRISKGLDAEKNNAISREQQIQELDSSLLIKCVDNFLFGNRQGFVIPIFHCTEASYLKSAKELLIDQ